MTTTVERKWLTVKEFAERSGLSRNFCYEMAKAGKLTSCKVGGKVLILANALDILAEARSDDGR